MLRFETKGDLSLPRLDVKRVQNNNAKTSYMFHRITRFSKTHHQKDAFFWDCFLSHTTVLLEKLVPVLPNTGEHWTKRKHWHEVVGWGVVHALKADLHLASFSRANDTFRWRMLFLSLHLMRMKLGLTVKPQSSVYSYVISFLIVTKSAEYLKLFFFLIDVRVFHDFILSFYFPANWKSTNEWLLTYSKVPWKIRIPTIYDFVVIYPWNLLFSLKVTYFLTVSMVFLFMNEFYDSIT